MAGVSRIVAVDRFLGNRRSVPTYGGSRRGYGWPATLELLSPPIGKPVDARHTVRLTVCPLCRLVHGDGGPCISRNANTVSPFCNAPATAIGNENPLELHSRTIQQLIAANLT